MPIPVNLYVDRMSPVQPVRIADVYAVTQDRSTAYREAAQKIGLTTPEYMEFRQALTDGGAVYVRLPRHIDAMAGVHRRNGHVYALRNVVVPSGTMGWQVNLADGTTVLVPQICGNLSMNRSHRIAAVPAAHKPKVIAQRTQPRAVRAASFVAPAPAVVAQTPVSFDIPAVVAPIGAGAPVAAAAVAHSGLPFLGLILPSIGAITGGHPSTTPVEPAAAPCKLGSNEVGVCHL